MIRDSWATHAIAHRDYGSSRIRTIPEDPWNGQPPQDFSYLRNYVTRYLYLNLVGRLKPQKGVPA